MRSVVAVLVCALVAISVSGCQKAGDTKLALPSVLDQVPTPAAVGSYVECFADHGHGPSKLIHLPADGTKNNVCFRDGVCFYGC
jgi:nitrous oxide reductase accessory protein NosL